MNRRAWLLASAALVAGLRVPKVWAQEDDEPVRVPSYRPPMRGAPGGRIGGGSRGSQEEIPTILVLAPDHKGLAATAQPMVYWYLSQATDGAAIKITVAEVGGAQALSKSLTGQVERGIHALSFAEAGVSLKADVEYEWRVSYTSPADNAKTMMSRGLISYTEPKSGLKKDAAKAKRDDLPFVFASAGYWYDALQALGALISENPGNGSYKLMRAALLDQVRLHDPADLDKEGAG